MKNTLTVIYNGQIDSNLDSSIESVVPQITSFYSEFEPVSYKKEYIEDLQERSIKFFFVEDLTEEQEQELIETIEIEIGNVQVFFTQQETLDI